jgi:hypothetical protein
MHYRTKALSFLGALMFEKVDRFIEASGQNSSEVSLLDVNIDSLPQYSGVVVMQYQ